MLKFRLKKHYSYVDFFIIIESEIDFLYNKKEFYLDFEDSFFDEFRDKIVHLIVPVSSKEEMINFLDSISPNLGTKKLENKVLNKDDILCHCLYFLCEFLKNLELVVWDLIFISDVDEIIDFTKLDIIVEHLSYGPTYLNHENYIWTTKFFNPVLHVGTLVMEFSQIVSKIETIYPIYEARRNMRFPKNGVISGWHLSHFYNHERTLKKMKLLHPELNLTRENIIHSMNNMKHPILNKFGFYSSLIENEKIIFEDDKILSQQYLGSLFPKKVLIYFERPFETLQEKFDQTINLNLNFFIEPQKVFYGNNNLKEFKKIFLFNEVIDFLRNYNFLNHDILTIVYGPNHDNFLKSSWKNLKNKMLYDLIVENEVIL